MAVSVTLSPALNSTLFVVTVGGAANDVMVIDVGDVFPINGTLVDVTLILYPVPAYFV